MKATLYQFFLICALILATNNISSAQDPCLSITSITPATSYSFSLTSGTGYLNANCSGSSEEGKEIIYEFTPLATGLHAIDVTSNNNALGTAVMYKQASLGCNSTDWTCVNGNFTGTPSYYIGLTSGTSYYIMFDRTNSTSGTLNITFKLTAPGTVDPCSAITPIPACETTMSATIGNGLGFINTQCFGGNEYGEEVVFSYTPALTGLYALDVVTTNNGDFLLSAYKNAASGCNSAGWTCLSEYWGAPSFYIELKKDTTYYILFDRCRNNSVNVHNITFKISCPGGADPCTVIKNVPSCGTVAGDTIGTGIGFINSKCFGGNEYGEESIFTFTPTMSGLHALDLLTNNNGDVLLTAYKNAAGGCNSSGWICLYEYWSTPSFYIDLKKDTTYYILFDRRRDNTTTTSIFSFKITCPGTVDPCTMIANVPTCGVTMNGSLGNGLGFINTQCFGGNEYGEELIYSFTPAMTGKHALDMLSNNNGDVLLTAYKNAASGCTSTGWTCIDEFYSTPSFYIDLKKDTTYYLLFDKRRDNPSNSSVFSFKITCPGTVDPCTVITPIPSCGTTVSKTLGNGLGFISTGCFGGTEYGEEAIFSYTATMTGLHSIDMLSNNNGDVLLLAYKNAVNGCNSTGWTCVDEYYSNPMNYLNLKQDTTYYFMFDKRRDNPVNSSIFSFRITCPGTVDPCSVITPIESCNLVYNVNLSPGIGFINTKCFGGNEYGREAIFSFTPVQTGTYSVDMLSNNNGDVLLFSWKKASGGCISSGWTCVDEYYSNPSFSLSLTADTTYYFLFDNRRDNANGNPVFSFKLSCPTSGDPCLDYLTVAGCGASYNVSLTTGTGLLDANCSGANEQGKEQLFSFTPASTGLYGIGITSNNSGDHLALSYKEASGGCNSLGWTCISNGFTGTPEYFVTLNGGTQYYFMFDRLYNNTTNTATFTAKFICQSDTDPCTSIIPLACYTERTDTISTKLGYYNSSCSGSDEMGEEKIYSYTPTATGLYTIDFLSNNNADYIAILYKEASTGCNGTGWSCLINYFWGTGDINVTLTGGTAYYFMFDREFTNQVTDEIYSFRLKCLAPAVYNVTGGGGYCPGESGVTVGLSGSETGVTYQLKKNGTAYGASVAGTGSSLSWSNMTSGTYTVDATNGYGTTAMAGSAYVYVHSTPVPSMAGPAALCGYPSLGNFYTTDPGMTSYSWSVSPGGTITSGGTASDYYAIVTWSTGDPQWVEVSYMGTYCQSSVKHYDVTIYPATVGGTVSGESLILFGMETTLTLAGNTGTVLKWQKRHNGGLWEDIAETGTSFTEIPDTTGTWDYRAEVQNGSCSAEFSGYFSVTVEPVTRTINLTLFLEGLYNTTSGEMNKAQDEYGNKFAGTIADVIQVKAAKPYSPYTICFVSETLNLNQDGTCTVTIPRTGFYYLIIKHRNSIETWSGDPVNAIPEPANYDFSTSAAQAYGYNMRNMAGRWVFWGGDVNQDGIVDSGDMNPVDNLSTAITFGYVSEDVNGDGIVDASDMNIVDNNSTAIIMVVTP